MTSIKSIALKVFIAASAASSCAAFTPVSTRHVNVHSLRNNAKYMVATTPSDLGIDVSSGMSEKNRTGGMIDLTGIAFSGMKGKALSITAEDFPKANEIRSVIPEECFEPDTAKSLGYLSVSLAGTAFCTAIGVAMLGAIGTSIWTLPIWAAYSAVTGTVAMGLWVLAHECGHGAFSTDKKTTGCCWLHSAFFLTCTILFMAALSCRSP